MQDELVLLARVRNLEPEALADVHDQYYGAIFRYITFRVSNRETAEDLTSEVFTRLLSAVRDRHAPQRTLRGWLYGVATRVVADHHRKHARVQHTELTEAIEGQEVNPADALSIKMTHERIQQATTELTEDQQEVIALRFGFSMPIKEVAQRMGKSEGAVKQLQARAIATLSRKLKPAGDR